MEIATYRKDLYYVDFTLENGRRREIVMSKFRWWFYRIQFWRFAKFIGLYVLREHD